MSRACLVLLALLSACAPLKQVVDPNVAQLERFKQWGADRRYTAIVLEKVDCRNIDQICTQLHLTKGNACFEQGRRGVTPRASYECAISELGAGLDPGIEASPDTAIPFAEKLMEALRLRRDLSTSRAESIRFTDRLLARAQAFRAAFPEHPGGTYYEASGLYGRALERLMAGEEDHEACTGLEAIRALLRQAAPEDGRYAASLGRITRDVQATTQAECRS